MPKYIDDEDEDNNPWDDDYDDDEDDEDDEDGEDGEEEPTKEVKQNCFDLLIASFISNILESDSEIVDSEDKGEIVDQIMDVLSLHLDEDGQEMLENAFLKFEKEYAIQVQTQEIIQSFEWNKNSDEED